jgi:hypothetical protein
MLDGWMDALCIRVFTLADKEGSLGGLLAFLVFVLKTAVRLGTVFQTRKEKIFSVKNNLI